MVQALGGASTRYGTWPTCHRVMQQGTVREHEYDYTSTRTSTVVQYTAVKYCAAFAAS